MKYILGLLAICFCLALSVDVGAVTQPDQTEFVAHEASTIHCDVLVLDFAAIPSLQEEIAPKPPSESYGNLNRSCGSLENVITIYPSLQIEAPFIEKCQARTTDSVASVPAKENDDNCLSDFKVGWRA